MRVVEQFVAVGLGAQCPPDGSPAHSVLPPQAGSRAFLDPTDPRISALVKRLDSECRSFEFGNFSEGSNPMLVAQHGWRYSGLPVLELDVRGGGAQMMVMEGDGVSEARRPSCSSMRVVPKPVSAMAFAAWTASQF